jgi:hypothetical protein
MKFILSFLAVETIIQIAFAIPIANPNYPNLLNDLARNDPNDATMARATLPVKPRQSELDSILSALKQTSPGDAEEAQILASRSTPRADSLASMVSALKDGSHVGATTPGSVLKRAEDAAATSMALEKKSSEHVQRIKRFKKRQDLSSILNALQGTSPDDAAAAGGSLGGAGVSGGNLLGGLTNAGNGKTQGQAQAVNGAGGLDQLLGGLAGATGGQGQGQGQTGGTEGTGGLGQLLGGLTGAVA